MSASVPPSPTPAEPTVSERLRSVIEERLAAGSIDLPLLPEVAQRVLSACSDERTEVRHLATLIQRDPAMAANLLRVANSALYATPVPIVSLPQALARLGIARVREAALLISCQTRIFRGTGDAVRKLFQHSIAAGAFAQEFARMRRWNVEEAFLCGLLHDVGRPVLLQTIEDVEESLHLQLDAEARAAAIDLAHPEVGAALVKQWKLPARLAETIRFHHDPFHAPTCAQTAMMTRLSDELAYFALEDGTGSAERVRGLDVLEVLNVYPDELETLLGQKPKVLEVIHSLTKDLH